MLGLRCRWKQRAFALWMEPAMMCWREFNGVEKKGQWRAPKAAEAFQLINNASA